MTRPHLLALTAAALMVTGSAFAGPDCKSCPKDGGSDQGVYEVAERDGDAQPREGKRDRADRGERGDRADRGERGDRSERKRPQPFRALGLTEEQREDVMAIMTAARESAQELMQDIKAQREAGEEIDRESVREQMMAIRKGAVQNVYENVLDDEQRAKMDERRAKMEERRAKREGKQGDRPERKGKKDRGEKKDKGGNADLDL